MGKDWLSSRYQVLGGFLSPVHDAYGKAGLVDSALRVEMCKLGIESSDWINVDPWETLQEGWTRTLHVIDRFHRVVNKLWRPEGCPEIKVMFICGSDLLDSFNTPGLWDDDDIRSICDHGVVAAEREGFSAKSLVWSNPILWSKREKIHVINQFVTNDVSSTKVRSLLKQKCSVKYIIPDPIIPYIQEHNLYH
eukprot:TRINITY_DN210_c0_g1_i3.p1 TRINITY_DN210_c0_g1~~TRINITY_DN210_c0_g1_i3.p1  ORF type:complete len:193 (-),score=34.49 TRINITY_DN210_c0_g1_i3:8-586(-)